MCDQTLETHETGLQTTSTMGTVCNAGDDDASAVASIIPNPEDENSSAMPPYDYPLVASILLGDFFHNFADGIFLGNAWLFCHRHVVYAIVAATVYHEFAQEFADFGLLTHHCGLRVLPALVLNFISGMSVVAGGLIVLAADLNDSMMGATLAVSAGVYMHVAASQCLPRIQEHHENQSLKNRLIFLVCFAIGCIPIGLVLLNRNDGC